MASFGPGIRVKDIQCLYGIVGNQVFQNECDFSFDEANILEMGPCRFTSHFQDTLVLAFDADEIGVRVGLGARKQKASFPAARIDFEGVVVAK